MFKLKYWLVALALCSTAAACSSKDKETSATTGSAGAGGAGDSPTASDGIPTVGQTVTTSITAADGGDVKLGSAKLSIPGGALADDTDITLEIQKPAKDLPDADTVQGNVYSFGPDGTTFSTPADLSLPLPATPSKDQTAVVSWLDPKTNTWQDLETTVSGSSVTASVPHFTFFVIRFKGVTGPVDCSFTACGGDLVGVWNIDAGCFDDPNAGQGFNGCQTATLDIQADVTGTVEFKADNTFNVALSTGGTIGLKVPTECLMGATCDNLASSIMGTCNSSSAGCDCSAPINAKDSTDDGTYTTDGNTFTTTSTGDTTPGDTNEYCVTGNTLKVKTTDSDGKVTVMTGTRK